MIQRRPYPAAVLALFITGVGATAHAAGQRSTTLRRQAFEPPTTSDTRCCRSAASGDSRNPSDASAHRALASVLWLNMLLGRGAVTVDHYLNSSAAPGGVEQTVGGTRRRVPAPCHTGDRTADARRGQRRATPGALRPGAAVGLQASHIATVKGRCPPDSRRLACL